MKRLKISFVLTFAGIALIGCSSSGEEEDMKSAIERFVSANSNYMMKYDGKTVINSITVKECRRVDDKNGVCLVEYDHVSQGKFTREWEVTRTEFGDWKTSG